nr:MAG TPA: hypothetical protein [Caudoviricetes sp.]
MYSQSSTYRTSTFTPPDKGRLLIDLITAAAKRRRGG